MTPGLLLSLALGVGAPAAGTYYADVVYTGDGQTLERCAVTVADGKITALTPGVSPKDDAVRVKAITPGMIDLSARVANSPYSVEETYEVTPDFRVANTLDLFDVTWERHLQSGVTTVMASPYDDNCIGGLSVVLKTGGAKDVEKRTVRADAALRGAFGSQPSSRNHPAYGAPDDIFSRRPTTRMGVEWEWRKSFFDALYAQGELDAGTKVLRRALTGELPVFAQAWATQDVRTAVFLVEEMKAEGDAKMRLIVDCGAEAWREPELLVRSGAAVVLAPYDHDGRTTDGAFYALESAKTLTDLGVTVALSSHYAAGPGSVLGAQAGYAMRGGLTFDQALAAVTINPARLAGVDDRVGSLAVGKDADLALWNGTPFELSSRVVGVVLDGDLVVAPE
ncbi:MAG: amidohydrolase family protein [Planctomycetes bacterium]|nr:amidohydrolase family protein [Planctomycetota bacterium]